ncbi:uncharacterized protein Dwil_GK14610 [Drosophila willistoni]|uniref:DUF4794 domain-containing protein n=1 Tax=Drosophila willistoni TaxID=7260 RepID=B4MWQ4_DROWI|nr:mucin-5AC [Drosophila willistoni]EDW76543.1 uncharacterized protein Dwil_GK14610 [Drosophila willistoni]
MPRIIALILLLTIAALSTAAPSITTENPVTTTANSTLEDEINLSSMPTVETETFTIEIDPNVVFTTDPEGLAFTEFTESAMDTTEEPLPESVLQQLERERVELKREEEGETTIDPRVIATTIRNYVTINRSTSDKPLLTTTEKLIETSTEKLIETTTVTEEPQVETTTESIETTTSGKSLKNYFASANIADGSIISEEEERGTEPPLFEDLSALLSENELEETHHLTENKAQIVDAYQMLNSVWQSPVESTTSEAADTTPLSTSTTETQPTLPTTIKEDPDTTTAVPDAPTTTTLTAEQNLIEAATTRPEEVHIDSTVDTKIFPTTHYPENDIFTTLEPEISTRSSTANYPASFSYTTLTPETTPSPSTTIPETTSNPISYTTLASETTSNPISYTTLARESTSSSSTTTTLAPETTLSTTTTTEAPILVSEQLLLNNERTTTSTSSTSTTTTTTSTTETPTTTTTTTTTPRPIQTRAPRIERIFNSDGVEVLYGYSSVVRTNRLN